MKNKENKNKIDNVDNVLNNESHQDQELANINPDKKTIGDITSNFSKRVIPDRINHPFTQIDNRVLTNKDFKLTPDEKVALVVMLSLPNGWYLNIPYFNKMCGLTKHRSIKARAGLVEKDFLEQIEIRRNGRKAYNYVVYELPKQMMKNMFLGSENKSQNSGNRKQEPENAPLINNKNKKEMINNKNKKDLINICGTKSSTESVKKNFKSKEENTVNQESINHDSYENLNMSTCILSNKHTIEAPNEIGQVSLDKQEAKLEDLTTKIADAEAKIAKLEVNNQKRLKAEKVVYEFIDESDIDSELKRLLKQHVTMRREKGIKTTITMMKELYEGLISECKTLKDQKQRVRYAISSGYPTFINKITRYSDKPKVDDSFDDEVIDPEMYEAALDENGNPLTF